VIFLQPMACFVERAPSVLAYFPGGGADPGLGGPLGFGVAPGVADVPGGGVIPLLGDVGDGGGVTCDPPPELGGGGGETGSLGSVQSSVMCSGTPDLLRQECSSHSLASARCRQDSRKELCYRRGS
jgi:hypothetical protein